MSEEDKESVSKALTESIKEAKENKEQLFYIVEKKEEDEIYAVLGVRFNPYFYFDAKKIDNPNILKEYKSLLREVFNDNLDSFFENPLNYFNQNKND